MQYYTVTEAAEATGADPATIRAMARDGFVEAYDEGGRWVLPERAVDKLTALAEETEAACEEDGDDGDGEEGGDEDEAEADEEEGDADEDDE